LPKKRDDVLPPPEPGTYTLILRVLEPLDLAVGALGVRYFPKGLYSYTGSALGSTQNLRTRVARHLRTVKKRRWHIDYLLDHAQVLGVVYCVDHRRLECSVVQALGRKADAEVVVEGFGSSDCPHGCSAHLYHHAGLGVEGFVKVISQVYGEVGCDAVFLPFQENDC
jgi:sugar fermentation stimulation protein A